MRVLDFGAGTCWLARFLIQLNCDVICCDSSPTALGIGERLFRDFPLIGTVVYRPTFLVFDGHRIDLPDESIDRVICFDAFHHVPNTDEVLAEFARVLRPGGIAGFSEPGRRHSQSAQSQYEMRNHKVLENDIEVNAIFAVARRVGFSNLTLKVALDMDMSLNDQNILFAPPHGDAHERLKATIWNNTVNTMTNRAIFFLHKGPFVRDSRSHVGLAHHIDIGPREYVIEQGQPLRLDVKVSNVGDATWLHTNTAIFGIVRLATHLYDREGNLLELDFSRHDLPATVAAGQAVQMQVQERLPGPGTYRVGIDLVSEGVTWFENVGSSPVQITVTVR
jgi:hypothetical protein